MPKAKCPTCATVVTYAAGYDPICPNCGFRGEAPAQPRPAWSPLTAPPAPASAPAPAFGAPPQAYNAQGAGYATQRPAGLEQGMAVGALVCGLVGFLFPPVALVAVILGGIAMGQVDREPQRYGGKGMAVAGLVLGLIVLAFWLVLFGAIGFWDDF